MYKVTAIKNAPPAIGCYSQAIQVGNTIYISGQLGINPLTQELATDFLTQLNLVFKNILAITQANHGNLSNIVKLNIFLVDIANFMVVNEVMETYFNKPYPARSVVGVKDLPKGALVEIDAIMVV